MAEFVANYGIWVVAAFIALESVGIPLPAEAALIAAGFFAARTHGIHIWDLIAAGIIAAIVGEIVGFWIGRRYGHQLLARHGSRLGLTPGRIRIGQWLFARYGGRFVFIARFLPILRNMAAVLAGTNAMAQHSFYFASATAASAWILCYGLAAYSFGEAFGNLASPAAAVLGLAAAATVLVGAGVHRALREAPAGESRRAHWPSARQPRPRKPSDGFAPAYVAPRRLRIRSNAA